MSDGNINRELREGILAALKAQWPDATVVTLNTGKDLKWFRPDGTSIDSSKHRTVVATGNSVEVASTGIVEIAKEFLVDPVALALYIGGAFWYGDKVYATILYIEREKQC